MKGEKRHRGGGSARFIGQRGVTWLGLSTTDSVTAEWRQRARPRPLNYCRLSVSKLDNKGQLNGLIWWHTVNSITYAVKRWCFNTNAATPLKQWHFIQKMRDIYNYKIIYMACLTIHSLKTFSHQVTLLFKCFCHWSLQIQSTYFLFIPKQKSNSTLSTPGHSFS